MVISRIVLISDRFYFSVAQESKIVLDCFSSTGILSDCFGVGLLLRSMWRGNQGVALTRRNDYQMIYNYSSLDDRINNYVNNTDTDKLSDDNHQKINNENLKKLMNDMIESDDSEASRGLLRRKFGEVFTDIINEKEKHIYEISRFLATSDNIEQHQKKRFERIFKEYNPTQNINFKT